MKILRKIIAPIAAVILIITLMNLGLQYGQDLWHKNDEERLSILSDEIESLEVRMSALKNVIENTDFGNQSTVDRYNELAGDYNDKVNEANELSEKVGTRYMLRVGGRARK